MTRVELVELNTELGDVLQAESLAPRNFFEKRGVCVKRTDQD